MSDVKLPSFKALVDPYAGIRGKNVSEAQEARRLEKEALANRTSSPSLATGSTRFPARL